jgi:hypothetical protein
VACSALYKAIMQDNNKEEIVDAIIPVIDKAIDKPSRMFKDLKEGDRPLSPLPPDNMSDIQYPQFIEPRCSLCTSAFRDLAEHVYLESGKKPQTVINFFHKYFDAKLNWVQVNTHMEQHCDFKKIATSGLKNYEQREELIAPWIFREHHLALTALLVELDDVRGMDCSKNNDMKLKRAAMVEKLITKILYLKEARDNQGIYAINIFDVLVKLHEKMDSETDKRIIREEIQTLKSKIRSDN